MKKLELFEEAMCCSTGVCGPSVDQTLLMITSAFEALEKVPSIEAVRYNLTSSPEAYVNNLAVLKAMQENGANALPITILDGEIVKTGAYPTLEEIGEYTGVVFVNQSSASKG
ncbi:MAG: arsenite efflux transporter metallochaperone ArsD [Streptococcaceae bacterium]|jgi:hypothetical protein|nr:arsenite efflux transporter metallochaperone ArsD [Streptococcaceae bacterium]